MRKTIFFFLYENIKNVFLLNKYKPDVIISNDPLMSIPLCLVCKMGKTPFIFDNLDDWANMEKKKYIRFMLKYCILPFLYSFSTATTNTSYKLMEVAKKYNNKSFVIPNGVSIEFINQFDKNITNNNSNKVHFISTLRDWYDFDLMFDVFSQFPDLELHIHGKGPLYKYLVEKSKLHSNIFIRGYLDPSLIHETIAESLFGILPLKLNEMNNSTSPIKLFDYWAAKKVIISSSTYEMKKIGGDCLLFANTKDEYLKNVKLILENKALRDTLGENGYRKVKDIYNYKKIGETFEKLCGGYVK